MVSPVMEKLLLVILLFPLLGAGLNLLFGNKVGEKGIGWIANAAIGFSFLTALSLFFLSGGCQKGLTFSLFEWFHFGNVNIPFSFYLDGLSGVFVLIITGIGSLIHLFSIGYMHGDKEIKRYFIYLNLFIFFMLTLVMASNYLLMFVGWEGVGLCSYLLIGFWYQNNSYSEAANKAFIMNRIGDLGFLLGAMMMAYHFGSLSFGDVFPQLNQFSDTRVLTTIGILFFIGAMGKSAQLPLFTWLPDAMAGPTPVSALIHAATMVTAGIYLLARTSALYVLAPMALDFVLYTGLATALMAALIAVYQNDIKKILAYSTVSQLGLMFAAVGAGGFGAGVFHVLTHAAFKALLFLGAGSVIHGLHGEQNIFKMGGLKKNMPVTYMTFLIATLAISGIPPFAGFFSKDLILVTLYEAKGPLFFGIALLISLLTAFYMFRLFFLTFHGEPRNENEAHESPAGMKTALLTLAFLSVVLGFLGLPHIIAHPLGLSNLLEGQLKSAMVINAPHLSATTEIILMAITLTAVVITIILSKRKYGSVRSMTAEERNLTLVEKWAFHKFYLDELYAMVVTNNMDRLAQFTQRWADELVFQNISSLSGRSVRELGLVMRKIQNGNVGSYFTAMVLAMSLILIYFIFQ